MKWFNQIMDEAVEVDASDLHLTAGSKVRMRINDELIFSKKHKAVLKPEDIRALLVNILSDEQLHQLDTNKSLLATINQEKSGRNRLAISQQRGSYYVNLKLGNRTKSLKTFKFTDAINEIHNITSGLILITGPTGSGKSTTCAQIISNINKDNARNIVTIERSIEYLMSHDQSLIKQKEIGIDVENHLSGLKFSLKEDADVIYLDEVPDKETLTTAIRAAEQGKLVIATLNTKDSFSTIQYVLNSYDSSELRHLKLQFANSLKAIISQKIIKGSEGESLPVFEVLLNNNAIKRLILEDKLNQLYSVMDNYNSMGMINFDAYIAKMITDDQIEKDLGLQVASSPKKLNEYLNKGTPNGQ